MRLVFNSVPPGAAVHRGGRRSALGTTPLELELRRSARRETFVFRLGGHQQARRRIALLDDAQFMVRLIPLTDGAVTEQPVARRSRRRRAAKKTRPARRGTKQSARRDKGAKALDPQGTLNPFE